MRFFDYKSPYFLSCYSSSGSIKKVTRAIEILESLPYIDINYFHIKVTE